MIFGYARVSTDAQKEDLQIDKLNARGVEKIFTDKISGAKKERPELDKLLGQLRRGDKIVVYRLDRLSRSMKDLIELVGTFEEMGVEFESMSENIDTTAATGKLIFGIFSSLAEFERNLIRERTKAGLDAARARGRVGGRPSKLSDKERHRLKELYDEKKMTIKELCKQFEISKATLYKYV